MSPEEIIELAKKCGMETETYREVTLIKDASDHQHITKDILLAFATEIRNRTLDECANRCAITLGDRYYGHLRSEILALKGDDK